MPTQSTASSGMSPAAVKWPEADLELIRKTFCDNEALLKAMRALFFGLGVSDGEKEAVRSTFANADLLRVVRQRFLPVLSKESPIGQVQDVWLGAEQMIFGASKDTIAQAIKFKAMAIEATEQALALLTNPDGPASDISVPDAVDELGVQILARNQFIRHVEQQLTFLWIIAGQKVETPKEAAKRAEKDSNQ